MAYLFDLRKYILQSLAMHKDFYFLCHTLFSYEIQLKIYCLYIQNTKNYLKNEKYEKYTKNFAFLSVEKYNVKCLRWKKKDKSCPSNDGKILLLLIVYLLL